MGTFRKQRRRCVASSNRGGPLSKSCSRVLCALARRTDRLIIRKKGFLQRRFATRLTWANANPPTRRSNACSTTLRKRALATASRCPHWRRSWNNARVRASRNPQIGPHRSDQICLISITLVAQIDIRSDRIIGYGCRGLKEKAARSNMANGFVVLARCHGNGSQQSSPWTSLVDAQCSKETILEA